VDALDGKSGGVARPRRPSDNLSLAKPPTATAAIYLRVSTEQQTTANQEPDCLEFAKGSDWEVVEVYREQQSAVKRRPVFDRMMADARRGRFRHLIVWRLDRFGRRMQNNINDVLALDGAGVHVVSVREPWLDSGGSARNLLLAVFSWLAEEERRVLGERVKAGLARARREGVIHGRPPPSPVELERAAGRVRTGVSLRTAAHDQGIGVRAVRRYLAGAAAERVRGGISVRAAAREYHLDIKTLRACLGEFEGRPGFLSFDHAREFVRALGMHSAAEWRRWCASDSYRIDIPTAPDETYQGEWKGWGDWLGYVPEPRLAFPEAREYARRLGLQSVDEWWRWCKSGSRPRTVPYDPRWAYPGEFCGWPDWLGYERKRYPRVQMVQFFAARAYARRLRLRSSIEWKEWALSPERPRNIPFNPQTFYLEWQGWPDWLGYSKRRMLPFKRARQHARRLGLESAAEWKAWAKTKKRPRYIPAHPDETYRADWRGWPNWLGKHMMTFRRAREYVRQLKLKSSREWEVWARSDKRPRALPARPMVTYQGSWRGMQDWLGCEPATMLPFRTARRQVRLLGLRSRLEWNGWARSDRRPGNVPSNPWKTYATQWRGLRDWLAVMKLVSRSSPAASAELPRATSPKSPLPVP
jgi:DNA invertase Pin-like site-specific DNA recombinase